MSLAHDVWPAMIALLNGIKGVDPAAYAIPGGQHAPLVGFDEGEQMSIPQVPWAWLMNDSGEMPKNQGPDLAKTNWRFNVRLFAEWTNDQTDSERLLMPIVEQIRVALEAHIKMGTVPTTKGPGIVFAQLVNVEWGYIPINDIWYRSCDLIIVVEEKEIRNVQA